MTSRRAELLLCGLLLLCGVLFLHREVLLSGMVYHMDDAADGYYPSHAAIGRAYASGELPTWERGSWSGFPLLADPYYGAFYPLSLLFAVLGLARGLGVVIALHTLIGALGMYLLCRRRGLCVGAALLGGVALGFSSFMVERIRHIIFPELLSWLPVILWAFEGHLLGIRRSLPYLAAALGMALICGALPLLPFYALLLLAYMVPRLLSTPGSLSPRRLLPLGIAGAAGLLIAMAQIVPTLAHLPHSPRQLGVEAELAASYAWPRIDYLALLVAPDLFGGSARGSFRGVYNHWEMAGWYVGAVTILLSLLGAPLRGRRRPELIALLLVALCAIGLAFGNAAPLHPWFFKHVPVYGALRCPVRALFMLLFCAPLLGAEAADALLGCGRRRWAAALCLLVGAALLGAALLVRAPAGQGPALLHLAVVVAAALLVLGALHLGLPARLCGPLLALVVLVDLVAIGRHHTVAQPADFPEGTQRFAAVDHLLKLAKGGDIGRFALDPNGPFRLHNLGMVYGTIEGATGYDSYSIWRYVHLLYIINHGAPYPYPRLRHDPAAGDISRFDSPLVDLLGVRWVIGPSPPGPAPRWVERFAPSGPPLARFEPVWDPRLRLYENTEVLPRAFVVYRAEVLPDDEAARRLAGLDPRRLVILDGAPQPAPLGQDRPPTPAKVEVLDRHRLVISVHAEAPGVLVVSEPAYPGWSATLDGQPAPLLRADYALRGVALPAGDHRVEMRFVSRPARLGLMLLGLGLLLLLGLCVAPRLRALLPTRRS